LTVRPDWADAHCSYTGAAKVDPAPETAPEAGVVTVGVLVLLAGVLAAVLAGVLDDLLLPHAARPSASTAMPASAPSL
jgi:hypothetical protein